ncbi:MAG: TlpA disulfide reductase family protein [Desulfuromonadales bacterium]|nr:TlpA disulfide reductase family protein [Desulfuromonadales bacterium]
MPNLRTHLAALLCIALLAILPGSALGLGIGESAPDFQLPALDGQTVSLADYRGRVVLLKLATTWCPTCGQLSAEIAKAGEFLKEADAVFLDVFVQDTAEMVQRHLEGKTYAMTSHALLDDGQAYKAYNVYLIPRLLFIDGRGKVRYDSAGQVPTAQQIKEIVAGIQQGEEVN